MKADRLTRDAAASTHAHSGTPGHEHDHDHSAHSHAHAHAAPHAHAHAHSPSPSRSTPVRPPLASLLMSSALLRLAGAIALSALMWSAVAWALSGTP